MVGNSVNDRRPEASCAVPLIESAEGAHLNPPRFWWLKRLLVAGGLLMVALIGLRLWWGWTADRLLQEQIAGYRADGELVYAAEIDVALAKIPGEENAALLYEKAAEKFVVPDPPGIEFNDFVDASRDSNYIKANLALAAKVVDANEEPLALIHQARSLPRADWACRMQVLDFDLCGTSSQRQLARLLSLAASYHMQVGDHRLAIESLRDLYAQSTAISKHPTLVNWLSSIGCGHLVVDWLEACSSSMFERKASVIAPPDRLAVEGLIAELLDEERTRARLRAIAIGERASELRLLEMTFAQNLRGTPLGQQLLPWVVDETVSPLMTQESRRLVHFADVFGHAVLMESWPDALPLFLGDEPRNHLLRCLSRPLTGMMPFYGLASIHEARKTSVLLRFRSAAHIRLAATALAIRLYQIDHGHRPDDLARLVPDYLDSVPRDPFAKGGGPIRFGSGEHGDVLYSVHTNGIDDDGIEFLYERDHRNKAADLVFYLDGRPDFHSETDP